MNCEQFEKLIALEIEGDLPDKQVLKLSDHLSLCGSCRRFAEELRDSQMALHGYTGDDFDESLLAGIRHNVLAEINQGNIRHSPWDHIARWLGISDFRRFAWAMTGVAAVLAMATIFAFLQLTHSQKRIEIDIVAHSFPIPHLMINPPQPDGRSAPRRQRISYKQFRTKAEETIREVRPTPTVQDSGIGLESMSVGTKKGITRLEIQTANPNIKIILIADSKPNAPPAATLSSSE